MAVTRLAGRCAVSAPQDHLAAAEAAAGPGFERVVGRWQILGLSINDVVGSGIYLLPAATALLLGPASLWGVLLAGLAVCLLVLTYAQAASYFDQPGGSYLYAREAFGSFIGFEVGWMIWLTRVASAAALSNGLAAAVAHVWPAAKDGFGQAAVVVASLLLLTVVNVVGVKSAARFSIVLVIGKLLPLVLFIALGVFYTDWSLALAVGLPPLGGLGEAALLLLFAYAGFENIPAAAGEYRNPRRDVPFALVTMIIVVTALYAAVQLVAQGTLPGLAASTTPLADAAAGFGGSWFALVLTVGAIISILGTTSNTMLLGPRFLYALAADGFGPRVLARIHPRFRTPAMAIVTQGVIALVLALSGSFVALALLSAVTRLVTYIGTCVAVLVLRRRHGDRPGALQLPGGPAIPLAALVLSLGLLVSASIANLVAGAVAMLVGAVIYFVQRGKA